MVYLVEKRCCENMPVFKIRPQEGEGKVTIVHCNMFMPLKEDQEVLTKINEPEPGPEYGTVQEETNDSGDKSDMNYVTVPVGPE